MLCGSELIDAATGSEIRSFQGTDAIRSLSLSGVGQRMVTQSDSGLVTLWDARSGEKLRTFPTRGSPSMAMSANGRLLLTGSMGAGRGIPRVRCRRPDSVAVGSRDRAAGPRVRAGGGGGPRCDQRDGDPLPSASTPNNTATVWSLGAPTASRTLAGHAARVTAVAITRWAARSDRFRRQDGGCLGLTHWRTNRDTAAIPAPSFRWPSAPMAPAAHDSRGDAGRHGHALGCADRPAAAGAGRSRSGDNRRGVQRQRLPTGDRSGGRHHDIMERRFRGQAPRTAPRTSSNHLRGDPRGRHVGTPCRGRIRPGAAMGRGSGYGKSCDVRPRAATDWFAVTPDGVYDGSPAGRGIARHALGPARRPIGPTGSAGLPTRRVSSRALKLEFRRRTQAQSTVRAVGGTGAR